MVERSTITGYGWIAREIIQMNTDEQESITKRYTGSLRLDVNLRNACSFFYDDDSWMVVFKRAEKSRLHLDGNPRPTKEIDINMHAEITLY